MKKGSKRGTHIACSLTSDENDAEDQSVQFIQQQKTQHMNLEEFKESQVIEVSDDGEDEEAAGRSIWHYMDPQGNVQGPFPVESLKHWSDANYFPPDFKVWKTGQSQEDAALLNDVLLRIFYDSHE